MSVANRIARARRLGGVDSNQYTDANAITDLNAVYHEIEDAIVAEKEDYFWDYFKASTVVGQSEYELPNSTSTGTDYTGTNKVLQLSIKYSSTATEYTKARKTDIFNMDREFSYYESNQSTQDPMFHVSDGAYFVYPAPTEAVTSGIKGVIIKNLRDLTTSDAESVIFNGKVNPKYHTLLELGMLEYIFREKLQTNEANAARNRFEIALRNFISNISSLYDEPIISELPNINHLG